MYFQTCITLSAWNGDKHREKSGWSPYFAVISQKLSGDPLVDATPTCIVTCRRISGIVYLNKLNTYWTFREKSAKLLLSILSQVPRFLNVVPFCRNLLSNQIHPYSNIVGNTLVPCSHKSRKNRWKCPKSYSIYFFHPQSPRLSAYSQ